MPAQDSAPSLAWVGDRSLRLSFGEEVSEAKRVRVQGAFERLRRAEIPGVVALTPAYATVLVEVDLGRADPTGVLEAVRAALAGEDAPAAPGRLVEVPVCYDDDFGADLAEVARLRGLTREEVVRLHSSAEYVVHFLGFTPGFPYLGGLPSALATPRLERPRVRVPAGSVAIAGAQAGIYPQTTPGGWRLLGRTPLRLFDAAREPATLLAIGDRVRFVPIPRERFEAS